MIVVIARVSAKWWGQDGSVFSKEKDFKKDWAMFLSSVGGIRNFLSGHGEQGCVRARSIGG